ncbi:hypothetical protein NLJ89_g2994 [Agrocybe chaxingu]|uniref:Cyclin-like domain-containing protein n=1 Tax=Agrocybe chaxingu TaxID=84603 RepID=A0A9W8K5K5_9AGAR|nr:hypothetical protein NLJ89_g2994 [Agrocybe chaxingu]
MVDRATLAQARYDDLQYVDDPECLDFLAIYFANLITKLGKKLQFRQRVIATATVFFRRFYLKNSYCETDPFTVIAACCYLAAKAEESPIHIKVIVAESRAMFSQENYNVKNFSSDNSKIAEMEFYLVDDLEGDLIVFHPYRTLLSLCRKESGTHASSSNSEEGEADEGPGVGIEDGPRYWGTGEGQLELTSAALQTAWSIINDTYRSQLCLLHPPHLIAIASIYLTFILHPPARPDAAHTLDQDHANESSPEHPTPARQPRRSSRQANHAPSHTTSPKKPQDPIAFLADLNVSLPLVASIAQEIISLYTLWDRYKEDVSPEASKLARELTNSPMSSGASPLKRTGSRSESGLASTSGGGTPSAENRDDTVDPEGNYITPAFLSSVLQRMREAKLMDMAPRPVAVNKRLERTLAAG